MEGGKVTQASGRLGVNSGFIRKFPSNIKSCISSISSALACLAVVDGSHSAESQDILTIKSDKRTQDSNFLR